MTSEEKPTAQEMGARGGKKRAELMSKEERSRSARLAAAARWDAQGSNVPVATYVGALRFGESLVIPCGVLEDGRRLLTQEGFLSAIGRARKAKGGQGASVVDDTPAFLAAKNLQPFVSDTLRRSTTSIVFRSPQGARGFGYQAELLPEVCCVFLDARAAGKLAPSQEHIAVRCEILIRALAKTGIVALVDEATGYQAERERDALQKLLAKYVRAEWLQWTKFFPDDFFKQVSRVHGWQYTAGSLKRPGYVGHFINKFIYERLPDGVLKRLQEVNPSSSGRRARKHSQHLTEDTGHRELRRQIAEVTTVLRLSEDKQSFLRNFRRAFPDQNDQLELGVEAPVID